MSLLISSRKNSTQEWIGVDLDGTLAEWNGWSDDIGAPIRPMVNRVKQWLAEGKRVKILTARGTRSDAKRALEQRYKIIDWCIRHLGDELEVTNEKDVYMSALYDDRAVAVEANTGRLLSPVPPDR